MKTCSSFTGSADDTSYEVDISSYNVNGFCEDYTLRRHKFEAQANAGCQEARADWLRYVGPVEEFGGFNAIDGNFTALVLPLCRPGRLRLVAYILECKCVTNHILYHLSVYHVEHIII
jgi:ophiobolin F synthase